MKALYYPTKCWKEESPEKHNINIEIIHALNNMIEKDFSHFYKDEFLSMKTRDIAKLGYLYLNNGLWEDHRLISSEYIQE